MQFDDFPSQDSAGWGVTSPKSGDIVANALKKEKVLKEILSYQEDLRGECSPRHGSPCRRRIREITFG